MFFSMPHLTVLSPSSPSTRAHGSEGILTFPVFKGVSAGCQDQVLSCSQPCPIAGVLRSRSGRPEAIGGPSPAFLTR